MIIEVKGVSYRYPGQPDREAIENADLTIEPGVTLLMGPNGAGKTTLLHLLATLLYPRKGTIDFLADDDRVLPAYGRRPSLMERVFFLPETLELQQKDINTLAKTHAPFYPGFSPEMLRSNLEEFGVDINKPFKNMSLGEKKRALFSHALSLGTDLLLLDEPVNGMDMGARDTARSMLARCTDPERQCVVMSTHTVADFKPLFDDVVHIKRGHITLAAKTWKITDKLAFVMESVPSADALYTARDMGMFRSIVPIQGREELETDIDLHLLYQALGDENTAKNIIKSIYGDDYKQD